MRRRANKKRGLIAQGVVERLTHEGRGILSLDGKNIFVSDALPGEVVNFQYTNTHRSYDEGVMVKLCSPNAKERVEPLCAHTLLCGGCCLHHMHRDAQIVHKEQMVLEQLKHFGQVVPVTVKPPIVADATGYRRKARLGVRYVTKKETVLVGFREKNGRYLADIPDCAVLHPDVSCLLLPLRALINDLSVQRKLSQIEVAVGDNATALVLRHLAPLTHSDLTKIIDFGVQHKVWMYLQGGGIDSVQRAWPSSENPALYYHLPDFSLTLDFEPHDFIQVNAKMNQKLVSKVVSLLQIEPGDKVLDLFCGIGNITLALARKSGYVVGVEGSQTCVQRGQHNALKNNLKHVEFVMNDLSDPAIKDTWWGQISFDKMVLDPPRTGALQVIEALAERLAHKIVYVSCNPATFARDAGALIAKGYQLTELRVLDMFAHTAHVETLAVFDKE